MEGKLDFDFVSKSYLVKNAMTSQIITNRISFIIPGFEHLKCL